MSGLYDRVQRSPRQKTFPWWAVILAIALVVLTCIGLFISRPQHIKNRYEACMDAVSASSVPLRRYSLLIEVISISPLADGFTLRAISTTSLS